MKQALLALTLLCGTTLLAQGENKPKLPNVLIIGDSISIGYTPPLTEMLKGKANVFHNPGNAAHSSNGVAKLDRWLGDTKWDIIHFNHGLHDLKYMSKNPNTTEKRQVQISLDQYRENMEALVTRLKQTGAKLIFATTTPVPQGTQPQRLPEDAAKYNAVALEIMKKNDVMVNDLYTFVLPQLKKFQRPKNVHFTPDGYKALAHEVEKHVLKALGQSPGGDH